MLQDIAFHENVKIKVLPRSKKSEIIGKMEDGTIKIKIKAIPEDGKANTEIISFLNKNFPKKWEIVSGFTSSRKLVKRVE